MLLGDLILRAGACHANEAAALTQFCGFNELMDVYESVRHGN
jgi:hypothetical protein